MFWVTKDKLSNILGISNQKNRYTVASTRGLLWRKVFLEISHNLQENTCARVSFLIKLQASGLQPYQKRNSGAGLFL